MGIDILRCPEPVRQLIESLRYAQVTHPVHVDVRRDIDGVALERVGRVVDDIQVTREAETLTIHRHKSQVDTRRILYHHCVHDIVMVEAHGKRRRQRTHKAVDHQVHVVLEDIHRLEHGLDIVRHTTVIEQLVQAFPTFGEDDLALFSREAGHIVLGHRFAEREGKDRGLLHLGFFLVAQDNHAVHIDLHRVLSNHHAVHLHMATIHHQHSALQHHRIHIRLEELEVAPETVFVQVIVERLNGHRELLVRLHLVRVLRLDTVLVLVGDDILDQFHRRITLTTITFAGLVRLNHHILQRIDFRLKDNEELRVLAWLNRHHFGLVTDTAER